MHAMICPGPRYCATICPRPGCMVEPLNFRNHIWNVYRKVRYLTHREWVPGWRRETTGELCLATWNTPVAIQASDQGRWKDCYLMHRDSRWGGILVMHLGFWMEAGNHRRAWLATWETPVAIRAGNNGKVRHTHSHRAHRAALWVEAGNHAWPGHVG